MASDFRLIYLVSISLNRVVGKSFLDVGCGFGRWGLYVRSHMQPSYLVGIDVWKPYLQTLKEKRVYDDLIVADAAKLPFTHKAFDVCLACDVIEHLPRWKGEELLTHSENVARETVIVTTPNYVYLQGELRENPYEKHVSFWNYKTFADRGYRVNGLGFNVKSRLVLGHAPFLRRLLSRMILKGKLLRFAELIVATKTFL